MMTTKPKLSRDQNKTRDTTAGPSRNCISCGAPIEGFEATAPGHRTIQPCGCDLKFVRASDIAQEF